MHRSNIYISFTGEEKKKKMKSFPFNLLLSLSNRGKKVLIVLIERTRDDIRLSLREEKGNRLWMFLSDILSHPRFHVCRNVLPHERHPRLRVRLSGQDNDTKCWRRRGVCFDRRKNLTIMPSGWLRIAHFQSLSLSLCRLLFLPSLPLLLSLYNTTNILLQLSLSRSHVCYFFISILPLRLGSGRSFVVATIIRGEKYQGRAMYIFIYIYIRNFR